MKPAHEELMRRLTLNDESALRDVMSGSAALQVLDDRSVALVQLAGLIATQGDPTSFRTLIDTAQAAGAGKDQILGVPTAVAPIVGSARIEAALPTILAALQDG